VNIKQVDADTNTCRLLHQRHQESPWREITEVDNKEEKTREKLLLLLPLLLLLSLLPRALEDPRDATGGGANEDPVGWVHFRNES
jgi:hypothetical protein